MKYICETLFRLKEVLQFAVKLSDKKLRREVNRIISSLDEANREVECLEEEMNEKKKFNYFS